MTATHRQLGAVAELIAWLPKTFPRISRRTPDADMGAAAALARCSRLLLGLQDMTSAGDRDDLVGLFVRPIYETWLTGMYLLQEGPPAWEELKAGARRMWGIVDDELNLGIEKLAGWVDDPMAPHVQEIARRVSNGLRATGEPAWEFPNDAYTTIYRTTSNRDSHGGAGPLAGYVRQEGPVAQLYGTRPEATPPATSLLWCAHIVGLLAQRVFKRFELSQCRWKLDEITEGLGDAKESDAWKLR